jgi:hypothetical protein
MAGRRRICNAIENLSTMKHWPTSHITSYCNAHVYRVVMENNHCGVAVCRTNDGVAHSVRLATGLRYASDHLLVSR